MENELALTVVEAWSLILGIVTPFVVSLVEQPRWSPLVRRVASVAVALVVGVGNLLVTGALSTSVDLTPGSVIINLALVLGAAQAAYALLWKPTGLPQRVEHATAKTPGDNT